MSFREKNTSHWHPKSKLFLGSFVLFAASGVLAVFFILHFFPFAMEKSVVNLSAGWELACASRGGNIPISNLKELGENRSGEALYLSKVLEQREGLDTLLLKSSHQHMKVFLDGTKLFENSPEAEEDPGIGLYFVRLPKEYGNKVLRLEISSSTPFYAETANPVYLGAASTLYAFVFSEAFPDLFYMVVCLVTGFFLIGFSAYSHLNGLRQTDKLCLGLFSVLWGLYCISWDDIACLFFSPVVISKLSAMLHVVYLIPFMAYFRLSFTICRRFTFILFSIFCGTAGSACLLLLLSVIDVPDTVFAFNHVLDVVFLPMIVLAGVELKRGNPLIRFLSPTILLIILGVAGTILEMYNLAKGIFFYLAAVFLFICANWIYHLKEIANRWIREKKEFRTLELKNQLMINRYDEMKSNVEKIRVIRHEMKHHFAALQILCGEKNLGGIAQYLAAVSENPWMEQDISYSRHPIADCILSDCAARSRKLNIRFESLINIPESLPLPDSDLCSLLLNMLDNAVEASALARDKWIRFKMSLEETLLVVSCQNSYCGDILEQNGAIVTRKPEKELHGFGIPIMRAISEKYGSVLVISHDSDRFLVKTVLQLQSTKEAGHVSHSNL